MRGSILWNFNVSEKTSRLPAWIENQVTKQKAIYRSSWWHK